MRHLTIIQSGRKLGRLSEGGLTWFPDPRSVLAPAVSLAVRRTPPPAIGSRGGAVEGNQALPDYFEARRVAAKSLRGLRETGSDFVVHSDGFVRVNDEQ